MPKRPDTENFRALFLGDVPMLDLRSPAEFAQGAFPSSINLPLMTDEERAQVGTCYKQRGQAAALELGHKLVSGQSREQRMAAWQTFVQSNPEGYLYCFRGGLRSATVQSWLAEAGLHYPRVHRGYKAMRRFLLESLEQSLASAELRLICGPTGSGKTRVIEGLSRSVDLEGRAGHRGSSFGQLPQGQPSQINFENALSIDLLKQLAASDAPIYLEDEGRMIGSVHLPQSLRDAMAAAPVVQVDEPLDARVTVIVADYVLDLGRRYVELYGQDGPQRHRDKLQADLLRIRKRLGGARQQAIATMLEAAFDEQWRSGEWHLHRNWVSSLLENYYDPMYEYQLSQREGSVLFRGSRAEVIAWASEEL